MIDFTSRQVPKADIAHQLDCIEQIHRRNALRPEPPHFYCQTFGCQQNEADTERIAGMLAEMGYVRTQDAAEADVIVVNTCAVREHAEKRVFGIMGQYTHIKETRPDVTICMCGCMVQQEHIAEKIKKSYPRVDIVFGTHMLWRFPELLLRRLNGSKRIFEISGDPKGEIAEGLPVQRDEGCHAWLSIMYGCNNFCTYCIVPYVRGRERSRQPEDIEAELRQLVAEGYKDITLLGQNVNSYGKDLGIGMDFADLLTRLDAVPGEYRLRFMTSHPKDASEKLFAAMAKGKHICHQLHLPFQSGSDAVLKKMNRGYTKEAYLALIEQARRYMPDLVLSSDIIVGFPGETEEDFQGTLDVVRRGQYDLLYTFLYSKRSGTPAAEMPDDTTAEEKQDRFNRLLQTQEAINQQRQNAYQDRKLCVLIDGLSNGKQESEYTHCGRTDGGLLVLVRGEDLHIGNFVDVEIEQTSLRTLYGRVIGKGYHG
ncbi:tRNA (N6-isopentenyl adenosine(37)-C2)-methylthiotransferase MiaB [Butyricicoccus sp.]|uniref:tRNA (N6-isopentenyl adenosine(37)-C2)-methylthiotransferase MiaB n=1 Tax=Butyricicoccus sp. TaxID=2049021 RepID=UPI003734E5E4